MFGFFKKLMPTRNAHEGVNMVADLDSMISKPVGIRLFGKVHQIKPMDQETFLKTVNSLAQMDFLRKQRDVNREKILDGYAVIFASCCNSISRKDVEKMTEAQISGFFNQVILQVQGVSSMSDSDQKKKSIA